MFTQVLSLTTRTEATAEVLRLFRVTARSWSHVLHALSVLAGQFPLVQSSRRLRKLSLTGLVIITVIIIIVLVVIVLLTI